MNDPRTVEALLKVGVIKVNHRDPYIYASRKIGPVYLDARLLASDPLVWSRIIQDLLRLIRAEVGLRKFGLVSGGELADLLFSIPVAMRLRKPHLTIRKKAKGYGLGGRLVGRVERGTKTLHISDLITTGSSALDWVGVIRDAGGIIDHYVAVVDRMQGGREALASDGVRLHSLVQLDRRFLEAASKNGALPKGEIQGVLDYLNEPEDWARRFLKANPRFINKNIGVRDGALTRNEGLEVLTLGYPEVVPDLAEAVKKTLKDLGVKQAVEALGFYPEKT